MTIAFNVNSVVANSAGNAFGTQFSDNIWCVELKANTDTTINAPADNAIGMTCANTKNKYLAVFSYTSGNDVFVALNTASAQPASNTVAQTSSEQNPAAKMVKAGDVIHMQSSGTPNVTVAFYSIQD